MRTQCRQLRLILWKNYLTRKRQKVRLAVEILWPLSLILLLAWVRTRGLRKNIDECHVSEKVLPSAGALAFLQNWFCTILNSCEPSAEKAKIPPPNMSTANMLKMLADLNKAFQEYADDDIFVPARAGGMMARLASRISRPGYEIKPWPLKRFLERANTLAQDLNRKNVNVSSSSLTDILDFRLLNSTYDYSPYALILDEPPALLCDNVSKNVTHSESAVNKLLCEMKPEERTQFAEVLNGHWNASFEKDVVRAFIGTGLDKEMSLEDVMQARTILRNISEETGMDRPSRVNSTLSENNSRAATANSILEKYLCNRTRDETSSLIDNAKNKASELQLDVEEKHLYVYDNFTTPRCNAIFQRLQETPEYYFIFKMLKPLILGQILYTPVTPKTDQIMKLLNGTYMQFGAYRDLIKALVDGMNLDGTQPNPLKRLTSLIQNPAIWSAANSTRAQFVLKQLIARVESNGTSGTFDEFLGCLEFDKVRGIHDYFEAEKYASELLDNERLYALVVFDSELEMKIVSKRSKRDTSGRRSGSANMVRSSESEKKASSRDSISAKNTSVNVPSYASFAPRTVFRIRMDAWIVDDTRAAQDRFTRKSGRVRPFEDLKYITYGFIYLQDMIELSIISVQTGTPIDELPGTVLHQYPHPCYNVDELIRAVSGTFPLIMVLAWLFTCAMIVKSIVLEKELRLKQTMQVMGLKNYIFWIGWFVESLIPMTFVVLLISFVLIYGKVVFYTDGTTVFCLLFLYALATICLSFLLSCFFSRANIAAACGGILFFILYLPYPMTVRWRLTLPEWAKYLTCLSSNVALGFGAAYMAEWESQGVGLNWERIWSSPVYGDSFNVANVMLMLIADCIIYCLLTWYIEAVFPGQYGIPLPWYFFATKSYWFGTSYRSSKIGSRNASEIAINSNPDDSQANKSPISLIGEDPTDDSNMEREPTTLNRGVEIKNLTKVYNNGKVAVNNLNMNFYENQITSFLGHNGAGKTTTISILTGIYPPTSGTAYVSGFDIRTELPEVRKNLGMCPQFNVLFSRLTVLEHLQFYGYLRGNPTKEVSQEFEQMLVDLNLPDKRHSFPGDLSGGMQRKLSIAAAFIGGSKVVILDEPTSGVDPYSRRSIWELLLKYKKGRTVILTTHYMDEADLLGDRIGIISNGQVQCSGSSMFLKNKFGSGFILTVELTPRTPTKEDVNTAKDVAEKRDENLPSGQSSELAITSAVKRYIPDAFVQSKFGNEIVYALPTKDGKLLERLCSMLDDDLGELGGVSYGVSDTSLEEIFLRITDEDLGEETLTPGILRKQCSSVKSAVSPEKGQDLKDEKVVRLNGASVKYTQVPIITGEHVEKKPSNKYWRQFVALQIKRFHHYKRNTKSIFSELVLPPILVAISLAVLLLAPSDTNSPPLELSPSLYNDVLFHTRTQSDGVGPEYEKSIFDSFGLGTDCLFWDNSGNPCNPKVKFFDNPRYQVPICSCSTGSQICPPIIDEPPPPHYKIVNNYTVVDSNKFDPSTWFLRTVSKYGIKNIGGFEFGADAGVDNQALVDLRNFGQIRVDPKFLDILPTEVHPRDRNIKVWFNNKAWISSVANLNAIHNNMLRVHVIKNGSLPEPWQQYGIEAYSHPMELTDRQRLVEAKKVNPQSLLQAIAVIFALSFVTASFCMYLIEERISNAKHLQLVSGVNRLVYWVQSFTWDYLSFLISVLLCVFVFLLFDAQAYISKEHFPAFLILLALYGWSCIPMMYPPSFFFSVPSTAFVSMGCGNVFVGILTTISVSVLEAFDDEELKRIGRILKEVFLIFPQFCLGDGMMKLAFSYHLDISLVQFGIEVKANLYSWSYLGKNFLAMFLLGLVFFLAALFIEFKVVSNLMGMCRSYVDQHADSFVQRVAQQQAKAVIVSVTPGYALLRLPLARRLLKTRFLSSVNAKYESVVDRVSLAAAEFLMKNKNQWNASIDEDDVALERKRVHAMPNDLLLIKELSKKYPRKATPSVNKICLGVKKGECFGLLGLNGAGKTTTFKMLTGAVKPTFGDAQVGGFSIRGKSINDVRALLGYCPQFDALDPLLTPTEHLLFYARVRNIPSDVLHNRVDVLIKRMNLTNYRTKLAGTLSGGNKRKLSTAIALLGNPPLVFLDEPTSGMDPKARRFLWNCISDVVKEGGCVILTSHSMEECQALCNRLTIMVNGQLTCLGSSQHLKNKYGKGYLLIVRCGDSAKDQVKTFISKRLPAAKITEEHYTQLRYEVPVSRLSNILHEMEDAKNKKIVIDYSVMQTTLEEVFIRFAREQADPDDRKPKKAGGLLNCCLGKAQSRQEALAERSRSDVA